MEVHNWRGPNTNPPRPRYYNSDKYRTRHHHSMRLPSLEVSQTTTSQGQYPALLLKMETLPKDSNGSSCFTYMTSPISLAEPKPADIKLSKELEEALKPHGCFESQEELNHRFEVLGHLDALVKTWVKDLSMLKNMPESVAETVGGKIYTFGSYRLGVHNRGADIDALCVVPKHIDRSDYFTSFLGYLRKLPEVTDLRAIEEAFVPVIKMKYDNIEIDMLFARLAEKEVSDSLELIDDKILKNLDQKCVRSLNGCRVTDEILRLVPNHESFRLALRCIKVWAKKSGIYSNVLGYLGGVSWAMLVARTCQLYPNAAASTIVLKFFLVFSTWNWPKPVLLKPMQTNNFLQFPVWDPRTNLHDRFHVMPIITPAYPQQNSTFNTSFSTRTVMQNALSLGLRVTEDITAGKATWETLFEPPNFFQQYKHFIVLVASSNTAEDQLEWYGMVESKIRHLIGSLEKTEHIQLPHIWPISFPPVNPIPDRSCTQWFIGLQFRESKNLKIDLTEVITQFTESVLKTAKNLNLHKPGMELDARYVSRKRLIDYLSPEITGNNNKRTSEGEPKKRKRASTSVTEDSPKKPKGAEEALLDSLISNNSSSQTPSHVEDGIELDSGEFKSPLPVPTPNILNSGGAKELLQDPELRILEAFAEHSHCRVNQNSLDVESRTCGAIVSVVFLKQNIQRQTGYTNRKKGFGPQIRNMEKCRPSESEQLHLQQVRLTFREKMQLANQSQVPWNCQSEEKYT